MRRIDTMADIAEGLTELARLDPRLAAAIERCPAVPLRRRPPGFAAIAEIVLSQMVSKASAAALWRRLEEAAGAVTPAAILLLEDEALRQAGLSRAKAATLRRVAMAVRQGDLDLAGLCDTGSAEAMARLTAVKGIGPWTAEVYLLFAAGHPDIFPAGDVALQTAAGRLLGLAERPTAREVARIAEAWSPWRGVAARLLWAYYAVETGRAAVPVEQ